MKLFHLLSFTKELFLPSQLLLLDLTCFLCLLDSSPFFKEPARTTCYAFEAFSRGCILLA